MINPLHWLGTLLLLVAAILLLVTTISAPVIKDIAILKVLLTNHTDIRPSSVIFGTFGHCILDVPPIQTDQDFCFPKVIGYNPAVIMSQIDGPGFNTAGTGSTGGLTNALILHPIACGLAFIAFLLALIPGVFGALFATSVTALAWILALVVMAIDFALFGIIKNHVNSDGSGSNAYYSIGMWTTLAAMILLFLAMFMLLFSCFRRRKAKNEPNNSRGNGYYADEGAAGTKKGRHSWGANKKSETNQMDNYKASPVNKYPPPQDKYPGNNLNTREADHAVPLTGRQPAIHEPVLPGEYHTNGAYTGNGTYAGDTAFVGNTNLAGATIPVVARTYV